MINQKSIDSVDKAAISKEFIKPLYDSYCFSNIPHFIKNVLTNENIPGLPDDCLGNLPRKYEKVILLLVDGFGWNIFEKYSEKYPFLKRLKQEGMVSKLTSQFPSTTSAQLTTLHTGLNVGQSGIYEWLYYEPKIDAIISPILFSYAGKKERNTLKSAGVNPKNIFPQKNIYKDLKQKNINSYQFQYHEYAYSPYNNILSVGSEISAFHTFPEALINLSDHILKNSQKSYYYLYFGGVDTIEHIHGRGSRQAQAEIDSFLYNMEQFFYKELKEKLKKTLFILTSDHGHAAIDPKQTIYLNLAFPQIKSWIKKNKKGELLVPAGSCRDIFLHINEESLEEAFLFLKKNIGDKAEIYLVNDLINQGFFGNTKPSMQFLDRVGNLVIISKDETSVWWYEKDKFEITHHGHHGGLTKAEMEIPFACFAYK